MTMRILIEFALCLGMFHFGLRGPTLFVLPMFMGGMMNMRDIPYQLTKAGDVLLDLTLNNEYVPKSDVIFPCEFSRSPSSRPFSSDFMWDIHHSSVVLGLSLVSSRPSGGG
jgi:hypothetical protein